MLKHIHKLTDFAEKKKYTMKMLYTDTDGIILAFSGEKAFTYEELYLQMYTDEKLNGILDFNSLKDDRFKDESRNKQYGYMSSEYPLNDNIQEFVGISAKCYAVKSEKGYLLKGKGVGSRLFRNNISFENYKECMYNYDYVNTLNYNEFVKTNLVIKTRETSKVAMINSDIKSRAVVNEDGTIDLVNFGY